MASILYLEISTNASVYACICWTDQVHLGPLVLQNEGLPVVSGFRDELPSISDCTAMRVTDDIAMLGEKGDCRYLL